MRNTTQVNPNHYHNDQYDSLKRFSSYWHQIDELMKLAPMSILEVGVGSGLVSSYLQKRGFKITTLDIDKRLEPTVTGSILKMPFKEDSFDAIGCYEVLEHIPYKDFKKALQELQRVTRKYVVISLPSTGYSYQFYFHIPFVKVLKKLFRIPLPPKEHRFDGQHYWEIGKKSYPLQRIKQDMERAGFRIDKTYIAFENSYHRFFILEKLN